MKKIIKLLFNVLAYFFVFLLLEITIISFLTTNSIDVGFSKPDNSILQFIAPQSVQDIVNKITNYIQIPNGTVVNYIVSIVGFMITALGFLFVVFQVSALAEQINKQEEHYHKDSEFKNFLEATKMLTSVENANNVTAQISAMYLLYDFAKKYPKNNLEKVIKVLNKYATPAIYDKKDLKYTYTKNFNKAKNIVDNRKTINEWREYGEAYQRVASTALELNKKLFVHALEKGFKINLLDVIIFDFDIEKDLSNNLFNKKLKLFDITKHSPRIAFLCCNFSTSHKKEVDFSTGYWYSRLITLSKKGVEGRMDIGFSAFINCNLKGCNFSYSNLWGTTFEKCNLINTKFNQAECEGVNFIDTAIKHSQINSMLFLSNNNGEFAKFSLDTKRNEQLEFGIIYKGKSNCFKSLEEYEHFKDTYVLN
ncbi:MAG: pentapeptide repeat-containing protein [Methylococcaceae bacterium]